MSNSKEKQIKNAFEELVGKGNLDIMEDAIAEEYIVHAGENEYSVHSSIKEFVVQLRTAFPDLRVADVKFLAQDADTVIWQRTLEGTHEALIQGIPPSGKKVKWVEMAVTRVQNEKIVEEWVVSEFMGELLLRGSQV